MRLLVIIGLVMFIAVIPSISSAQVSNEKVMDGITDVKIQIARLETKMEEALKAVDKRIDDVRGLVYVALGGIMTLICGLLAMMGFVLWDRRTAITPVVRKAKELEQGFEDERVERVAIRKVLKGYALVEPRFAEVLRTAGML